MARGYEPHPLETVWDSYCPGWLPTGTPQSCLPHGQESFSPGPLPLPLDKSVQTLKSKIQQTISHPSEPLEKQSFSSAGSKGHICRLSLVDFDQFFLTIGKIFEKRNIQTTIIVVIFCFLFPNNH